MSKQVVSLLPGDQVDLISVADDDNYVTYYGDQGAQLGMPIETFAFDDKEYLIAKCSGNVADERIIAAIRKYFG